MIHSKKSGRSKLLGRIRKELGADLYSQLRPFQRKGVAFLERRKGRALLADDMGLGKTIQALSWTEFHKELKVVCVVPSSVKWNWEKEAKRFAPSRRPLILNGRKASRISFDYDMLIINGDILTDWVLPIRKWGPDCIIIDEAHMFKNGKAKRTKALFRLARGVDHVIALTGTPVVNAPIEFYRILKLIRPNLFPDFWAYAVKYCNARHNGFGWDFRGSKNEKELHNILTVESKVMLRRLKKDVLPELPPVTRTMIMVEETSSKIEELQDRLGEDTPIAKTFSLIEQYKQECLRLKTSHYIKWIKEFLESTDEKLVIFAHHKSVIKKIKQVFPKISLVIDGSVTGIKRQHAVEQFAKNKKIRLMLGNLKAAGVGITLVAACHALFLELPWDPATLQQAADRINRIGQEKPVFLWYMLIANSIETDMMDLIDKKSGIVSKVLDGRDVDETTLLNLLLRRYRKRRKQK